MLLPVVLIVLLAAALYCPPIQNWAVQKATAYASEQTGMEISIDNVRLAFPLDLQVNGIKVIKEQMDSITSNTWKDTIADINSLMVDVQLRPLFEGKVMVDALDFNYMKLNTTDFIKAAQVKGRVKSLSVASHGIDLREEFMRLDKANIDGADLDIILADSVPEDTTETEIFWKIQADRAQLTNSSIRIKGKDLNLSADIDKLIATSGYFDLGKSEYKIAHAELHESALSYPPLVSLSKMAAVVDSIYYCDPDLHASIGHLKLKENEYGAEVKDMQALIRMDEKALHVNDLRLETPYSSLKAGLNMDLNAFDETAPGNIQMAFDAKVGKGDIALFRQYLPSGVLGKLPNKQINASASVHGSIKHAEIDYLSLSIPNAISLNANGSVSNKSGNISNINGYATQLSTSLDCPNIDFLTQFVDPKILAGTGIRMPHGLPLSASVKINGGMKSLALENLKLNVPGRMSISSSGEVLRLNNLSDVSLNNLALTFDAPNIDFLTSCIDPKLLAGTGIRIPHGIGLKGTAGISGSNYIFDLTATEGGGWLKLKGKLNPNAKTYDVDAQSRNFAVNHFMPSLGVGRLTATASANGKGYDPFLASTRIKANGNIGAVQYDRYNLQNVKFDALIANGNVNADINSRNSLLDGTLNVNALMSTKLFSGTISGDIAKVNFKQLGLTEAQLNLGVCTHVDIDYDYADNLTVKGLVSDITVMAPDHTFRPDDIVLDIHSTRDTTHAIIDCGDLYGHLDARGSYQSLLKKSTKLTDIITSDLKRQTIDIEHIWAELPLATLELKAGKDNPMSRFIRYNDLTFSDVDISLTSQPYYGLNGKMNLYGVSADSVLLDTIRLNLVSDEHTCVYSGQVRNSKENPQFTFNSLFHGKFTEHGAQAYITLNDAREKTGIRIGADARLVEEGIRMEVLDDEGIILGYQPFRVNSGNYILLGDNNRISADMKLRSSDGKGLGIYTNDDNLDAVQDITLTVAKLNLKELLAAVPYAPDVRGILDGDFHYIQDDTDHFSVSSSAGIDKLNYSGLDIGNVSSEFVYMPEDDGGHHIDGMFFMDEEEIGSIIGSYNPSGEGNIDAVINLKEMPMHIANGFIPDQLFGLRGKGDGELTLKGTLAKPDVNGEIFLDSCHLYSTPYGVDMRFSNDPVRIKNSRLLLENFEMFAYNDNPLTIAGYIDFANISKMYMDVRMRAQNYAIINARENIRSEAYGKMFVDFAGTMKGFVNNLRMQGKLDVLPNTDLAYILRDSPLTTDNHLAELVQFVNTSDTTKQYKVERPDLYGFNMDLNINVTSGARVMAYLNTDHSNYVDISGNGQLRMTYTPADQIKLTGRYYLAGGEMKYSLPIIPLKTFNIANGSYVEFTGDMMNPRLNITAAEKNKAQVNNGSGGTRTVEFECGVVITKTLQDMGLEFTLDAPEDIDLKSDLATMSPEMRGKLAVTMLTTGMYLDEGNTSTFTMNTALNQFLQSEINNITGNALRTLDLSLGLDNQVDKTGRFHTDYSFKFAKRFLNNRLKVSIGGKVSTGGNIERGQNNSVFDNVELEYRLDHGGQKFLNLHYDNNAYDWLDGNTQEFGAGFLWRRSTLTFKELVDFLHKSNKDTIPEFIYQAPVITPPDSIDVMTDE